MPTDAVIARGGGAADLAVDLDGTLLLTDTLHEGFVRAFFTRPGDALRAILAVPRGPAAVKAVLARYSLEGASHFPQRHELIDWLETEKSKGRRLHLVTAAHHSVAHAVAERFSIFTSVIATTDGQNVKGAAKRDRLKAIFPEGFSYAGDSSADLAVFEAADSIVLAGHSEDIGRRARKSGRPVEAEFPRIRGGPRDWLQAMRLHQWSKNLLILVPLLLSAQFLEPMAVLTTLIGFVLMGLTASGTYILNDLSDLASDRTHRTKRTRPFASGALSVRSGAFISAALILGGLAGAAMLSSLFATYLAAYVAISLSYSLVFKRVAILDVGLLAVLYALRIGIGAVLADVPLSQWLVVFALFFFLSLSLAKRHVEIVRAVESGPIPGRGYRSGDGVLTLPLGIGAAMTSLLVMVIFLAFERFMPGNYAKPGFLWAAPMIVFLWLGRIWLLAARGELEDDPVSFAIKDRISLLLGLLLAISTLAALLDAG